MPCKWLANTLEVLFWIIERHYKYIEDDFLYFNHGYTSGTRGIE